jgi:hypothetical protein
VLEDKVDYISDFARRGLKRKGLDLPGYSTSSNPESADDGFDPRRTQPNC